MNLHLITKKEFATITSVIRASDTIFYVHKFDKVENIDSGDFDLDCPMYECENAIEEFLIKKLLSESEQKKLYYFKKKTQLEKNPLNKFCSQPDCGEVLKEHENGCLKCPKCDH